VTRIYADFQNLDGIVEFNSEEDCWVAAVDWNRLTHASEVRPAQAR
jgi:hypothetical protein